MTGSCHAVELLLVTCSNKENFQEENTGCSSCEFKDEISKIYVQKFVLIVYKIYVQ